MFKIIELEIETNPIQLGVFKFCLFVFLLLLLFHVSLLFQFSVVTVIVSWPQILRCLSKLLK